MRARFPSERPVCRRRGNVGFDSSRLPLSLLLQDILGQQPAQERLQTKVDQEQHRGARQQPAQRPVLQLLAQVHGYAVRLCVRLCVSVCFHRCFESHCSSSAVIDAQISHTLNGKSRYSFM